jgi:hypothetical protein
MCFVCGSEENLVQFEFGLAKTRTQRNWGETAASAILSAVSLPLTGFGLIRLPGKSTQTSVFTLRFTACSRCASKNLDYSFHPWFPIIFDYGYNRFIPPQEIEFLKSRSLLK